MKEKILSFIKKHFKMLSVILLILIVIVVNQCSYYTINKNKIVLNQTELEGIKVAIEDSMNTLRYKEKISIQDSVQKIAQLKVDKALNKVDSLSRLNTNYKNKEKKLVSKISILENKYKDSINNPCKEVINAYVERVDNLELQNGALTEEVFELDLAFEQDSIGWEACKKESTLKDSIIFQKQDRIIAEENINKALRKQLKKNSSNFKKSLPWISAGLGFVAGILVVK